MRDTNRLYVNEEFLRRAVAAFGDETRVQYWLDRACGHNTGRGRRILRGEPYVAPRHTLPKIPTPAKTSRRERLRQVKKFLSEKVESDLPLAQLDALVQDEPGPKESES